MSPAELTVDVTGLPIDARPSVEVRDWDLRVVSRVRAGSAIELTPGRYVLRFVRPDGDADAKVVTLGEGDRDHVLLSAQGARQARDIAAVVALSAVSGFAGPPKNEGETDEERLTYFVRVASAASGLRVDVPPPVSQLDDALNPPSVSSTVLEFDLPDLDAPFVAQVARRGMVPLNVALPAPAGAAALLRVRIQESTGKLSVATAPGAHDLAAQTLSAYLARGLTAEAIDMAEDRTHARGPIFNVLAGLAGLRRSWGDVLGPPLDESVAWLPDAWVAAGELALRRDDLEGAADRFRTALDRGLPIFTDALSIMARRWYGGFHVLEPGAASRLEAAAEVADPTTLTTTFVAADASDPAASQEPVYEFDGWFEFRRHQLQVEERAFA